MTNAFPPKSNRFARHRRKILLAMVVLVLVGLEGTVRVLARHGLVGYRVYPTGRGVNFWSDIDREFGVWHYPNATFHHQAPCFDVVYRSNRHGARDAEREFASDAPRRVVVLGDSFVEGFGVDREDRLTERLERLTGIEHLNFGTSGHFGSIQEWRLYETLASRFDHTDVFVLMLPDNDFIDNDPSRYPRDRYRPYLRRTEEGFELTYPVAFEHRATSDQSWLKRARRLVYNHVYTINALKQIGTSDETIGISRRPRRTYDRFKEEDLEILLHSYDGIAERAGPRTVTIFVVPRLHDFLHAATEGSDGTRLMERLQAHTASRSTVRVIDLLPPMMAIAASRAVEAEALFHACDAHWSPLGHEIAARAVYDAMYAE